MRLFLPCLLLICFGGIAIHAQPPDSGGYPPPDSGRGRRGPPGRGAPDGKWWFDPYLVQRLGLTKNQQQKIEEIFQQNRLKLINLTASLEKEQAVLDPLMAADHPLETSVLAQFDRVAEARLELEKANARMLWGFRTALSSDQWRELQSQDRPPGGPPGRSPR